MAETIKLKLEQILQDGEPGSSTSLDSALARPFRVLMDEGRNVGRLNHVFFTHSGHSYILGTLCNAPSGRLIFFPGLSGRKVIWDTAGKALSNGGVLDHITLEPGFRSWHLTIFINGQKDRNRLLDRNVVKIACGLHYWFGVSIRRPELLERAVSNHSFSFDAPKEKASEYSRIIENSKSGAKFHNLLLPEEALGQDEFLHLDFLIDRRIFRRWRRLPHNIAWVPHGPPALSEAINVPQAFPMRAHPVRIPGFRGDIMILVSKHRGKLVDEVIVGSAA